MIKSYLQKAAEVSLSLTVISMLILAGCGGGKSGSATTNTAPAPQTGVVYPVVGGLTYKTNSTSGVVAANGNYTYQANENVTFSAGGIDLANVQATAVVTPLPLEDATASTNLLRLLKALDVDHDLTNGISLPALLTTTNSTVLDLKSESSVASALNLISPASAVLPTVSDVQVAATLASAQTTAKQNLGTYGATYRAILLQGASQVSDCSTTPFLKDATVNFTSQPNWVSGVVSGTTTLTLNDNSTVTFPISTITGTFTTAAGVVGTYWFDYNFRAGARILALRVSSTASALNSCGVVLRDSTQPNKPPVPIVEPGTLCSIPNNLTPVTFQTSSGGSTTYKVSGPGPITCTFNAPMFGGSGAPYPFNTSIDLDGMVLSQTWTSTNGTTGTGNSFSVTCTPDLEDVSVTLTVKDDEGATASTTKQVCYKTASSTTGLSSVATLSCNAPASFFCADSFALNPGTCGAGAPISVPSCAAPTVGTCTASYATGGVISKTYFYTGYPLATAQSFCALSGGVFN